MKISDETLDGFSIDYPLEKLAPLEKILFMDIETTGFTARSSYLYMIGCAYYQAGKWHIIQWMAQNYREEAQVLNAFFDFAKLYNYLIHFNGNNFDLPYISQKCEDLLLPYSFDNFEGVDLYRRISPYKTLLNLPNCKQKSLEKFLGINREDPFSGGELIGIYHDYVTAPTDFSEKSLLLHNFEDIKGMLQIVPILAYYDLFDEGVRAKKVQANSYKDYKGSIRKELLISLAPITPLPQNLSVSANGCYLKVDGNDITLRVPLYNEELKYFYGNYHDYYYLPDEDIALHKSVATFVEKDHREQATARNCYTRKNSSYLRQWEVLFTPVFKRDYDEKELYFELTDEMKRDRNVFSQYANHILTMIAKSEN